MLAELVDKILSLGKIQVEEIDGRPYAKTRLELIRPPKNSPPKTLSFKTLLGLTEYVGQCRDEFEKYFLFVTDFDGVSLLGCLIPEAGNERFEYAQAQMNATPFKFGSWYDLESFIIAIQSMFVQDDQTNTLLEAIGNLASDVVVDNKDDGFSQTVQVKTGITTKSKVKITNPVTLRPYRTFREVDQPPSQFIFRIRKTAELQFALFESGGGIWKLEAIANIKAWLAHSLPEAGIIG